MSIKPIVDTDTLAAFCDHQKGAQFITVDTEFVREKTYYPILCLVQIAGPKEEAVIDAIAPGIDLSPLAALFADERIIKVLHASRQDNEIFYNLFGAVPTPLFDTQIAAMVCGFGDQVAYGTLAQKLVGVAIEKTSRFADWSHRPLTDKQLTYALSDVTHLRTAYEKLAAELAESGRSHWLDSEMEILTDPATYNMNPLDAWRRVKSRTTNGKFLAVLREVAAWRNLDMEGPESKVNRRVVGICSRIEYLNTVGPEVRDVHPRTIRIDVQTVREMHELCITVEPTPDAADRLESVQDAAAKALKQRLGFGCQVKGAEVGELPRFELKGRRFHRE